MQVRPHQYEADRLSSVLSYRLLDTGPVPSLDGLARLAAGICQTPTALIILIDEDRQWFVSRHGMDATTLPRSESVCSDVAGEVPITVPDLTTDHRYAGLPMVTGKPAFVPHFQPLVDMRDGTITGLEALLRWQHPTRGLLAPKAFLPGLEVGVLADWAGRTVLEAACQVVVDLRARGITLPGGVAINVSGRQLTTGGLSRRVLDTLRRRNLPGSALTVEITETAEIIDKSLALGELLTLRAAGVRVVADDFGAGWSNLIRLLELPISGLKIDKDLVIGLVGDRVREHMVASTVALAATMGLDVTAEGVETAAVRNRLLELGCYRGQGWLFSRALPAADLLASRLRYPFYARDRAPALA